MAIRAGVRVASSDASGDRTMGRTFTDGEMKQRQVCQYPDPETYERCGAKSCRVQPDGTGIGNGICLRCIRLYEDYRSKPLTPDQVRQQLIAGRV
jgi:hypothetical protein